MQTKFNTNNIECDVCVIGGGLSGCFASIEAARNGAKVVLMQDRPVLGGNASSEIRMWVRGAKGAFNQETGLISDLEEREIHYNPTLNRTIFDTTLYAMVKEYENITLLMNTTCLDGEVKDNKIVSVLGWQLTTYTYQKVTAKIFIDCSGDSVLASISGAEYRHGREDKAEFSETLAQEEADEKTMGMSIILAARETDHPVPFTPPPFANVYPDDECFASDVGKNAHSQIRDHKIATSGANLWWIELGGECHSIYDAEKIRDELLACAYGVWDHIKNYGDHGMENWELEWVGALPGKRESRRYVGDYILTEADILEGGKFDDEIAYGGWGLDDHNPYGMRKNVGKNIPSTVIPVPAPYGIPLRCLYSKNIDNLMFAGRNISATHVALSSTRVMATCALLGQAVGCASAIAIKNNISPRLVYQNHTKEVQKILMDNGVFLPHLKREVSALMKEAKLNIGAQEREVLLNGVERPRLTENENMLVQNIGETFSMTFEKPKKIEKLRLCFDPDFTRKSISENFKMRLYAMKLHTGKDFKPVKTASTLVKSFTVYADRREIMTVENNFHRLLILPLSVTAKQISIKWHSTHGCEKVHLFSVDLI